MDLLDVREVALRLGVKAHRIYAWVDSGELPSFRLGANTIRFRPAGLEAFI
jgi:excisionase family DNA binding protein